MKNVFNIDRSTDPEQQQIDGRELITRRVPEKLAGQIAALEAKATELEQAAELPGSVQALMGVSFAFGVMIMVLAFRPDQLTGGVLGGGFLVLVSAFLFLLQKVRWRKTDNRPEVAQVNKQLQDLRQQAWTALDVPENAEDVDIYSRIYQFRFNKERPIKQSLRDYTNAPQKVYRRGSSLCFAGSRYEVTIPLKKLTRFHSVGKRLTVWPWNKAEKWNAAPYRSSHILRMSSGFMVPAAYALELDELMILIAAYDAEKVDRLLEGTGK